MRDVGSGGVVLLAVLLWADPGLAQAPCGNCHDAQKAIGTHATLLPAHAKASCVDCHRGNAKAADKEAAHPRTGLDELLAGPRTQASCVTCHVAGAVAGTDLIVKGGQIYLEQGCQLCHLGNFKLGNLAAFAPPLSTIGGRGSPYLIGMLHDPKATFKETVMPSYGLTLKHAPEKETALVTFLLSLRSDLPSPARPPKSSARCATCHEGKKPIATELAAHKCRLILEDKAELSCQRCHKNAVPVGQRECLYILQRRNQCGVCHEGGVDG